MTSPNSKSSWINFCPKWSNRPLTSLTETVPPRTISTAKSCGSGLLSTRTIFVMPTKRQRVWKMYKCWGASRMRLIRRLRRTIMWARRTSILLTGMLLSRVIARRQSVAKVNRPCLFSSCSWPMRSGWISIAPHKITRTTLISSGKISKSGDFSSRLIRARLIRWL